MKQKQIRRKTGEQCRTYLIAYRSSSSSETYVYAALRALPPPTQELSSVAISALACCISKIASSQKFTNASSFSLSPPSVTIE